MNPKQRTILVKILQIAVSALGLTTILYIFISYYQGLYNQGLVLYLAVALLIAFLVFRIIKLNTLTTVIFFLITGHVLLTIYWGIMVPYLAFLPLLVTGLLALTGNKKISQYYLIFSWIITLLEITQHFPLVKTSGLEAGIANVIIFSTLQGLTYICWWWSIEFFYLWDDITILGLSELIQNSSRNFLIATIFNGLLSSFFTHFFNNYLNSIIWSIPSDTNLNAMQTLSIYSESDRKTRKSKHSIMDIVNSLGVYRYKFEVISRPEALEKPHLTVADSKIFLACVHNIFYNFIKHRAQFKNNQFPVLVCISSEKGITLSIKNILKEEINATGVWDKNLGTIKQFLQLSRKGTISIEITHELTITLFFNPE